MSGHPGWTLPARQPPIHTPITGLRVMRVGGIQSRRNWKAEKRKGDCERHKKL